MAKVGSIQMSDQLRYTCPCEKKGEATGES